MEIIMSDEKSMQREASSHQPTTEHLPLVVGIDLGGTQIRTAVLRGATLLSRVGLLTGENPSPDRVVPRMIESVRQALKEANTTLDQIAGIGIGAPGPLNSRTGVVYSPPNLPGWVNYHLQDTFTETFHVPVYVENDANAGALGEYMFGAGRGSRDIVYVTISTGIGGGVITDGRIIEGLVGTASELGHMTIDLHGPRCNCGNIGCWEVLASGTAIARQAHEIIAAGRGEALLAFARAQESGDARNMAADTPFDRDKAQAKQSVRLNARTVALAAEAKIPEAQKIIADAAEALGFGLVNVIHIFNPERIILGGGVMQIGDPLLAPALQIVQERAMIIPRDFAKIVMAELGTDVGLVGAGALTYYNREI
ncbi:MAG TPA: ROK family protein [Dictyobacter sp.]|nr:ROK family protein [Dictyobacter sp.]